MKRVLVLSVLVGSSALACAPITPFAPLGPATSAQSLAGTWNATSYQALMGPGVVTAQQTMVITPVANNLFTAQRTYTYTPVGVAQPVTVTENSLGVTKPGGQFTTVDEIDNGVMQGQLVNANTLNVTFTQPGTTNPVVFSATFTRQ